MSPDRFTRAWTWAKAHDFPAVLPLATFDEAARLAIVANRHAPAEAIRARLWACWHPEDASPRARVHFLLVPAALFPGEVAPIVVCRLVVTPTRVHPLGRGCGWFVAVGVDDVEAARADVVEAWRRGEAA